jgi:hypothetical protein
LVGQERLDLNEWFDQSQAVLERAGTDSAVALAERLDLIRRGVMHRRRADHQWPLDAAAEQTRERIVRNLAALQNQVDGTLRRLERTAVEREIVASQVRQWLDTAPLVFRSELIEGSRDALIPAMIVETARGDLQWLSRLICWLDGEPVIRPGTSLEVELQRLCNRLEQPSDAGRRGDLEFQRLQQRCAQLQWNLLRRRVQSQLSRAARPQSPDRMLILRLELSRLQAALGGQEPSAQEPADGESLDPEAKPWVEALALRRLELASQAERELGLLDLAAAQECCERVFDAVQDEIRETIVFLEDLPLRQAISRLELARQDLDQFAGTMRKLARRSRRETNKAPAQPTAGARRDWAWLRMFPGRAKGGGLDWQIRALAHLRRSVDREWQQKVLNLRLERLLGRRRLWGLEALALWLILLLSGLIVTETLLDQASLLPWGLRSWFAWADLAICSVLLGEFFLKWSLAPRKAAYLVRHFALDFVASLPFGFLAFQLDSWTTLEHELPGAAETLWWLRYLRFTRLIEVLRAIRLMLPTIRLTRLAFFAMRLCDRLVRRNARLLNRNIVLFEPANGLPPESNERHRLTALRSELEGLSTHLFSRLDRTDRATLGRRVVGDLEIRLELLPAEEPEGDRNRALDREGREIPIDSLVNRLIQMTPELLVDRMGPSFVASADRYLRLLDAPLVRRLPLIRSLVAYREKSPAEAVALAANYLGHIIQRLLDAAYFLADLQGTLSPPVFLDRLGATIVNATRTPAKRLLWLGSAFLLTSAIVNSVGLLRPLRGFVDRLQNLLGWPVIVLGVICLGFWILGSWFRKIANQSADFCERVVEAQFAAHTKSLKSRRHDEDVGCLARRVLDPELRLRSADDRTPHTPDTAPSPDSKLATTGAFENRELIFLRKVRLLYQDYLDGAPFHRNDTKASIQLLGNLALANLRRSHLDHLLREGRALDRLDLRRAGGLFGGPYLWFNYITRMMTQETALLLLDYNRHAIPLDRLSCSRPEARRAYQEWLARRLRIDPDQVWLPPLATADRADVRASVAPPWASRRPEADAFLETVEFTALDFLADDPERDAEIRGRFGPQVAALVIRDRQQNVRRAFRSFPLHEIPLAQRTLNPYAVYETYLSRGRILLAPLLLLGPLARAVGILIRSVFRVVRDILHPRVTWETEIPADTYTAAQRKIHRMRKPVFMGSLWLRARFDVEYVGLPLPTAPPEISAPALMDADLDFIGATRQDRLIADQIRRGHQRRLEWIARWLHQQGWTYDTLPQYLAAEIPHLACRGAEALRALVLAFVLDHDDLMTLGLSIEGLKLVMAHAADPARDRRSLPPDLPDPVVDPRRLWYPVHRVSRPLAELFSLPCFPPYGPAQRRSILAYLRRHRRATLGWAQVVLGQGGDDPWAIFRSRIREVLLRTDLWSDQIVVLRAVQTLTMLDVQHNSELVWSLGGYTPTASSNGPARGPGLAVPQLREAEAKVKTEHDLAGGVV